MDIDEFRKHGHQLIDWMADYMDTVEKLPVRSQVKPGEISNRLKEKPPINGEPMENIIDDFKTTILPGITHWQHPRFFAIVMKPNSLVFQEVAFSRAVNSAQSVALEAES